MRTFVFGAGASAHAGYPLASKLWSALEQWGRTVIAPEEYRDGAFGTMNRMFDMSLPFELALTQLDERIAAPLDLYDKACLPIVRGEIQHRICQYFDSVRAQRADLYDLFAQKVLAPGDVVITFNYDVSLDRELQKSGRWTALDGYGFALDGCSASRSQCTLLKLHGSTNWIAQLFGGLHGTTFAIDLGQPALGYRPVIPAPELKFLESGCTDPKFVMGTGYVLPLIMPAAKKKFYMETSLNPREWEDFWDYLWSQAEHSIAMSDELHIVGYSLPEYDDRARELLGRGRHRLNIARRLLGGGRHGARLGLGPFGSSAHGRGAIVHSQSRLFDGVGDVLDRAF